MSDDKPRSATIARAAQPPPHLLFLLFLICVFNFADRQVLAVLMQPIAEDLGLTDSQLGLLSGLAFSLFYAAFGIPIARLADRGWHVLVISWSVAVWSAMTILCGTAGNFIQLVAARAGVGIGEAGASPPAYSLIASHFGAARRATAMAFYSLGMPVGLVVGYLAGGWANELFGWRAAFVLVGAPGLILALVAARSLRAPPRPRPRPEDSPQADGALPLVEIIRIITRTPSLRWLVGGFAICSFVTYGVGQWVPVYFIRIYGMGTGEVGTWLALIVGSMASLGIMLGGYVGDRFGRRDERWYVRFPAYCLLLSAPFSALFVFAPTKEAALIALFPIVCLGHLDIGPVMSLLQSIVPAAGRATAAAVVLLITNFVGLGFGPLAIGLLSDTLYPIVGSDALRYAILGELSLYMVAAVMMWRAGKALRADLASRSAVVSDLHAGDWLATPRARL